jgi:hypothetical protein
MSDCIAPGGSLRVSRQLELLHKILNLVRNYVIVLVIGFYATGKR